MKPGKRLWLAAGAMLLLSLAAATGAWLGGAHSVLRTAVPPAPLPVPVPADAISNTTPAVVASGSAAPTIPAAELLAVVVARNDTLEQIFRRSQLSLQDLAALRADPAVRVHLDRLTPGETLALRRRGEQLAGLERRLSLTEELRVTRDDGGFHAQFVALPVQIETAVTRGVIDSSLFEAGNAAGLQDNTILELAKIFGWDINFILDLRAGDAFTVAYQRVSQNGSYVQDGDILSARFINDGRVVDAVRYTRADGAASYYSPDGRSMEKAFLRAPLEFRRVSSGFSRGRYHPILNRIRAHNGVDYAAAIGTPVHAAGAGRVRFHGRNGGYGNVIEIDHGGGIVTVYGHLSRFGKAGAGGVRVHQNDIIGYVGMSGLATGPHLHYEYRLNGKYLDPRSIKLPDATPIDSALMPEFQRQSTPLLAMLATAPAAARLP
jgi:murein DD-endopeptidase MepM/ murein hydrolase activator NlpD